MINQALVRQSSSFLYNCEYNVQRRYMLMMSFFLLLELLGLMTFIYSIHHIIGENRKSFKTS